MSASAFLDPRSLANPSWLKNNVYDALFIEAYELALAPEAIPRKIFRFDEITLAIKTAKLEYIELAGIKVKFGKDRQVHMSAEQRMSASELSPKIITVQPQSLNQPNDQNALAERSSEYISLLVSTNYRNIAFRRIFAHTVALNNNSIRASGDTFRLPFDLPPPDLSSAALERFPRCEHRIQELPPDQRRKTKLSLHWHLKGIQSEGVDSFLSLWIAIETLSMRSTNISDTNEVLAESYKITNAEAASEFGIGRIFGLRSDIVHNGLRRNISTHLTDYMECLYADLLVYNLLGESLGRARNMIISKGLDIKGLTSINN
ncbi:hypothetical protein ACO2Q2_14865 [Dyella sp. KRB-257]|uniref:hypothetical protein n=1 Tax=Dyella sp. KRB-257 TaxID=3400915 RepID=UPI003C12B386